MVFIGHESSYRLVNPPNARTRRAALIYSQSLGLSTAGRDVCRTAPPSPYLCSYHSRLHWTSKNAPSKPSTPQMKKGQRSTTMPTEHLSASNEHVNPRHCPLIPPTQDQA